MIAVTEVNGCAYCSYAHTKMALEAGMTNQEIQKLLKGVSDEVPKGEMSGVIFGQHYADTRGKVSSEAYERLVEVYGLKKAEAIIATSRIMIFGNAAGIAWGSFVNRFKKGKEADERSHLFYEMQIIIATFLFLPIAFLHALLAKFFKKEEMKF